MSLPREALVHMSRRHHRPTGTALQSEVSNACARLAEHDERIADLHLGMHDLVIRVPLTLDFGRPERRFQESEFGICIRYDEIWCNRAICVF